MSNREQTRDRLLYCEPSCCPPPAFPAPVIPLPVFEDMMYKVAYVSGYAGTKTDFKEDLASVLNGASSGNLALLMQKGSATDFPDIGVENCLYIDTERKQLYFWNGDGYYRIGTDTGSGGGLEEGTVLNGGDAFTR